MSSTVKILLRISRMKSDTDSFSLICPFSDCKHTSKSYHGLRVHLARSHQDEIDLPIIRKQIGKIERAWRRIK